VTHHAAHAARAKARTGPAPAVNGGFGPKLVVPLMLGSVLNPINSTMIATVLVAIGGTFHAGAADTAWLVSSLYLASAVAQPAMGRLADRLGPRRVFLAGLLIVAAAGLVGGMAQALSWLIVSRVLLGIGTSAAYPAAMALLRAHSQRLGIPTPRPVLGLLSLAGLSSAAIGPVLGGVLAATLGWRAIFAVNVPLAAAGFALATLWLPAGRGADAATDPAPVGPTAAGSAPAGPAATGTAAADSPAANPAAVGSTAADPSAAGPIAAGAAAANSAVTGTAVEGSAPADSAPADPTAAGSKAAGAAAAVGSRVRVGGDGGQARGGRAAGAAGLDPAGLLLFAAVLTTVMFFLMRLDRPQWPVLALAAVLAAALTRWELRRTAPFLDLRMLARNRGLCLTYLRHGMTYLVIYCVMYGYAQWLEQAHGMSTADAGLVMLPMSVAAMATSLLGARTRGIRAPLTVAAVLLVAGGGVLLAAGHTAPALALAAAGALFGLPQGLASTGNQAAVYAQAPPGETGSAAGLQRTAQYLGAISAAALIGLFYGQRATDTGLHDMAMTAGLLAVAVLLLTVLDRSLRTQRGRP
jgi:MFS family permease